MARMLYQGHGSYRFTLEDGTVVYVDPFAGEGYDLPADLVLVTHEHGDHNQVDKMPHADGCVIVRAADLQPAPGFYTSIESRGMRFTGVQACNKNHPIDQCVGVIIEIDGISFYASGDTSMTDDMRSGKLAELALDGSPIGGARPSKEVALHLALYAKNPEHAAVVHVHSPSAVAAACLAPSVSSFVRL